VNGPSRTHRSARLIIVVLLCASILLASEVGTGGSPALASTRLDPWYVDLRTHWSRPYVYVLWSEGVTNGYRHIRRVDGDLVWVTTFEPNREMTRAELLYMMAKVFRLKENTGASSWPDLPRDYRLYGERAYGLLHAAVRQWKVAPHKRRLHLEDEVNRLDVVRFLLSSLNLAHYSDRLTQAEVSRHLAPFKDCRRGLTAPDRATLATAVKFGLIIGFGDGTLRPYRDLRRSEAATILYRSCLVRVSLIPEVFSPDGDGQDDSLAIFLTTLKNRSTRSWQVEIQSSGGSVVRRIPPRSPGKGEPDALAWDGLTHDGEAAPEGEYLVTAWVEDRERRRFVAVPQPVRLVRHSLTATVQPDQAQHGQAFTVTATTTGGAEEVSVRSTHGRVFALTRWGNAAYPTLWRGSVPIDSDFPLGDSHLTVSAGFAGCSRECRLKVRVVSPAVGEGWSPEDVITVLVR